MSNFIDLVKTKKKQSIAIAIIIGLYCLFLFLKGPSITPDSTSYISMEIIRGPVYPLFLSFFRHLFGEIHYLKFVLFFQILLNVITAVVFCFHFYFKYKLTKSSLPILIISFLYPIYLLSVPINTEALAFPVFLLFIIFYISYLSTFNIKNLAISLIVLVLLIAIRTQFLFVIPIIFLLQIYVWTKTKKKWNLLGLLFILLILPFVSLVDKTYHYFNDERFMSTPFTGIQLLTDAVYAADTIDYKLFSDDKSLILKTILDSAYSKNLLYVSLINNERKLGSSIIISHYNQSYNDLCHRTIRPLLFRSIKIDNISEKWEQFDREALHIAFVLILNNPIRFINLYRLDIIENWFFNYYNLFLFFALMILVFSNWKNNCSDLNLHIGFILLLCLSNLLLVALVEPVMNRYTVYTDVMLGFTFMVVFDNYLSMSKIYNNLSKIAKN